nr:hypothetical protein [Porticoccaceae bacterium]
MPGQRTTITATENVTKVKVSESATKINITPVVTTVHADGVSVHQSAAHGIDSSTAGFITATNVDAALTQIGTDGKICHSGVVKLDGTADGIQVSGDIIIDSSAAINSPALSFKDTDGTATINSWRGSLYIRTGDAAGTSGKAVELQSLDNGSITNRVKVDNNGITLQGNTSVVGNITFDGLSGTGSITVTDILDEDTMSADSATALATQQSIKAYVDTEVVDYWSSSQTANIHTNNYTNTTYNAATTSADGLMSSSDKSAVDGIVDWSASQTANINAANYINKLVDLSDITAGAQGFIKINQSSAEEISGGADPTTLSFDNNTYLTAAAGLSSFSEFDTLENGKVLGVADGVLSMIAQTGTGSGGTTYTAGAGITIESNEISWNSSSSRFNKFTFNNPNTTTSSGIFMEAITADDWVPPRYGLQFFFDDPDTDAAIQQIATMTLDECAFAGRFNAMQGVQVNNHLFGSHEEYSVSREKPNFPGHFNVSTYNVKLNNAHVDTLEVATESSKCIANAEFMQNAITAKTDNMQTLPDTSYAQGKWLRYTSASGIHWIANNQSQMHAIPYLNNIDGVVAHHDSNAYQFAMFRVETAELVQTLRITGTGG